MPFAPKYHRLSAAISEAAQRAGAIAEPVDQQKFTGNIVTRIVEQIEQADAIVAVTTGKNPNVFYEVGFAHALRKEVILLTDNPKSVAFDLQQYKHVVYETPDDQLVTDLAEQLRSTLARPRVYSYSYAQFRKAVLDVEAIAKDLAPYLTPIARRACNQWVNDIAALSSVGLETNGRERLEITRSIVAETNTFSVRERTIGPCGDA